MTLPASSNSMPSTVLPSGVMVCRISSVGVATISASIRRRSSWTPDRRALVVISANASPSTTSASRIVRSFAGMSMAVPQS